MEIVDGNSIPWVKGADAAASMTPAFRDNLGPPAAVENMLEHYWLRVLLHDEESTRRIDHVRVTAGYADATTAYHASVEECLVLAGSMRRDGEGPADAGDYFWRPPGFIHSVQSDEGFEAVLMMEGLSPGDGSGVVTRVERPLADAGSNGLQPSDLTLAEGPRGFVRRARTQSLPWSRLQPALLPAEAEAQTLSENPLTGAASFLVRLQGDKRLTGGHRCELTRTLVVTSGALLVNGKRLAPCSLLEVGAGDPLPECRSVEDTTVLLKVSSYR